MARQLEPACSHSSQTCYGASSLLAAVRGLKRSECNCAMQAEGARLVKEGSFDIYGNSFSSIYEHQQVLVQCFTRPHQIRIAGRNAD